MKDQLQEVEAEEEASVVDSEVDFPVAAVASVVAEVILYTKRNNFKFLAYCSFLVDLLYTNTYANCSIKVASQEAVDMFQEAVDVVVAVEVEEEAVELTWE